MPIDKLDIEWSSDSVPSAPTDEKIGTGWAGGEQPTSEDWNWLENRQDHSINKNIVERANSYYEDASDPKFMISSGLWGDEWARPTDSANTISGGATKKYVDIAVFFDSLNNPRLLVLDNTNCKIEVWDARSLTLLQTTNALTDDLPSGGGETWQCIAMCTDGTDVYVALTDTNASPDTHQIQAWTIDEDASDWSVKTGWAATGTALTATGNSGINHSRDLDIIIASATRLAVASCCQAISSSSSPAITIVDITDGSILSEGAGDAPAGGVEKVTDNICSDGTYIYFVVNASGSAVLSTAAISDATTGSGGTGYPRTLDAASFSGKLCACGSNFIVTAITDQSAYNDTFLFTCDSSDSALHDIMYGRTTDVTPVVAVDYILQEPVGIVFDGINIWILGRVGGATYYKTVLCKIDVAKLRDKPPQYTMQFANLATASHVICETPNTANDIYDLRMAFDGRDIWIIPEPDASQTKSGKIYRLPIVLFR